MVDRRRWAFLLGLTAWLALPAATWAQAPVPPDAAPATTGAVAQTGRLAAPAPSRRPRSFRECNRDAQARRLRGQERRRFVYRCQQGSGRPLFRRRGPPTPPPAPTVPAEGAKPALR